MEILGNRRDFPVRDTMLTDPEEIEAIKAKWDSFKISRHNALSLTLKIHYGV